MSREISPTSEQLVERRDAFGIPGVRWTPTALELPPELDFTDFETIGWALGRVRDTSSWAFGDWIIAGEAIYGERYAQAIEATGRSKQTLINYASVARRVSRSRRRAGLAWSHHAEVAALDPAEQVAWLDRAEGERLTVEELRGLLRESKELPTSVGEQETVSGVDWQDAVVEMAEALACRLVASGRGPVAVDVHVILADRTTYATTFNSSVEGMGILDAVDARRDV